VKDLLRGVEVVTVPERGWGSMKNGELLRLADREFDIFITADQNLQHQQNVSALSLAIVVLVAPSNRLEAYVPLGTQLRQAVSNARPGTVTRVSA
jgi:hypothetical protein